MARDVRSDRPSSHMLVRSAGRRAGRNTQEMGKSAAP